MRRDKDVRTEAGSERETVAGFGGGGRSHRPRNVGSFWKLVKARKWILSQSLQRGIQLCYNLDFSPGRAMPDF